MIETIQFWAVLLWMIGMLVMAALAVRAVWIDAGRPAEEPQTDGSPSPARDKAADNSTAGTSSSPTRRE